MPLLGTVRLHSLFGCQNSTCSKHVAAIAELRHSPSTSTPTSTKSDIFGKFSHLAQPNICQYVPVFHNTGAVTKVTAGLLYPPLSLTPSSTTSGILGRSVSKYTPSSANMTVFCPFNKHLHKSLQNYFIPQPWLLSQQCTVNHQIAQ